MKDKIIIPCPACRENGSDKSGNHLAVFPSGKFSCAVHPRVKAHNQRILELRSDLGEEKPWQMHNPIRTANSGPAKREQRPVIEKYSYRDESANESYQVWRHEPKSFSQHRIVNGEARSTMEGVARIPYRLPEVIKAKTVWIVEGEKDVETLAALGVAATCNAGGAGKWDDSWSHYFSDKDIVLCGDNDDVGQKHMDHIAAALQDVAKSIRRVEVPAPAKDISDHLAGTSDTEARSSIEALLRAPEPLDVLLDARRFDAANPPTKPVPVLQIAGKTIATAGNLVAVSAQAKAGKTALETAMIASLMKPTGDCLGVIGHNADDLPVLHFDTEQSRFDHHTVVKLALCRAGRETPPDWLRSYSLADVSTEDRRKALRHEANRAAIDGKLGAIFIDGVADLCLDPNDAPEAFALVAELHSLAITHDCPVICILHENPGTDIGKTRGHLGSQLERKAETNLRLVKDAAGVTAVFTERSRHCHIAKEVGPRFTWDDMTGMHVSCASAMAEKAQEDDLVMQAIVDEAFSGRGSLTYTELRSAVMRVKGVKEKQAEKTIPKLLQKYARKTSFGYCKA